MKPLMNLQEYTRLNEQFKPLEARLDREMDALVEASSLGAAIGSPIKFTKIKNNLKKYMKTLVQVSINDLDFEKKVAAGEQTPENKLTLKAANKAKNVALKDKASAIVDRMDHLASTDGLKLVKKIGMNKSKMEAAKKVLKAASGEEAKQLKLKIDSLGKRIADDGQSLKDYEKEDSDDTSQADRLEDGGKGGKDETKEEKEKRLKKEAKEKFDKEVKAATEAGFTKGEPPEGEVDPKIKEIPNSDGDPWKGWKAKGAKEPAEDDDGAQAAEDQANKDEEERRAGMSQEERDKEDKDKEPGGKKTVGQEVGDVKDAIVDKAIEVKDAAVAKVTGLWDTIKGKVNSLADDLAAATEPAEKEKIQTELTAVKKEEATAGEEVKTVTKDQTEKVAAAKVKAKEKKPAPAPAAQNASFKPFQAKNNSYKHINESVREKFARLLNEKKSV